MLVIYKYRFVNGVWDYGFFRFTHMEARDGRRLYYNADSNRSLSIFDWQAGL